MLMLLACTGVHAYDFEKDGIYYNVTSLTDLTVEVTCEEEYASENSYRGDIVIPEQVEWNGKTFTVTGIGAFYFSAEYMVFLLNQRTLQCHNIS